MQITDTFTVQAPVADVWSFLLDMERMSRCVPGVETVEALDENTYRGVLKLRLGPLAATFKGLVTLTEVDPPRRLVATVTAEDPAIASTVKSSFTSTLKPLDGGTEVTYEMEINLRGRLAQFGTAVVRGTAKKMTAQFADNVRAQIEA